MKTPNTSTQPEPQQTTVLFWTVCVNRDNMRATCGVSLAASESEARAAAEAKAGIGSVCVAAYTRSALIHIICRMAVAHPPDPAQQDLSQDSPVSIELAIDKVLMDYHTPPVKGGRSAMLNEKIAAVVKREKMLDAEQSKSEPVFQGRKP